MFATDYVLVDEAARRSGLHPNTIRRLLREGKLEGRKGRRLGRMRWLVHSGALHEYVQATLTFASHRPGPRLYLRRWRDAE